jgi:hypothetical protein
LSLFALSIVACVAFLAWMRRVCGHANQLGNRESIKIEPQFWGLTVRGLFILQCSNYLLSLSVGRNSRKGAAGVSRQ